jgi:hypothetical protein
MRASLKKSILFSLAALSLGLSISASATPASANSFHGGVRGFHGSHFIHFWGGHRFRGGFGGGYGGWVGAGGCDYAGQLYSDGSVVNGKICVTGVWQ